MPVRPQSPTSGGGRRHVSYRWQKIEATTIGLHFVSGCADQQHHMVYGWTRIDDKKGLELEWRDLGTQAFGLLVRHLRATPGIRRMTEITAAKRLCSS